MGSGAVASVHRCQVTQRFPSGPEKVSVFVSSERGREEGRGTGEKGCRSVGASTPHIRTSHTQGESQHAPVPRQLLMEADVGSGFLPCPWADGTGSHVLH